MSALSALLHTFRSASVTEREKGTYFEELICAYLRNECSGLLIPDTDLGENPRRERGV
ncbi:hypothetical protein [Pseudomonas aeruginosa]|uniref:hypothetical protein n=1 Tax=Pseudomonas aeruginosa TaxID=287 RepID=UPI002738B0B0|nr:hypothetical protein [Pseudomonas aeruginosa]